MKKRVEHRVPLSAAAVALLRRLETVRHSAFVFPALECGTVTGTLSHVTVGRRLKGYHAHPGAREARFAIGLVTSQPFRGKSLNTLSRICAAMPPSGVIGAAMRSKKDAKSCKSRPIFLASEN